MPKKFDSIYQIKITLDGIRPPIWRRIQVANNTTLAELHDIIQHVMGWDGGHLHAFRVGERTYSDPEFDKFGNLDMKDETRIRLNQFIPGEGFRFKYEYDFGDSWEHTLLVEKILAPQENAHYPVCTKGKRACPPEDIGGT